MDYLHNYFRVLLITYREFPVRVFIARPYMTMQIITTFYGCQLIKSLNNDLCINYLEPAEMFL